MTIPGGILVWWVYLDRPYQFLQKLKVCRFRGVRSTFEKNKKRFKIGFGTT